MRSISVEEARRHIRALVREVGRGHAYTVTLAGKPIVRMEPQRARGDLRRARKPLRAGRRQPKPIMLSLS